MVALAACEKEQAAEAALEFPVGHPEIQSTFVDKEYVGRVEAVRYVEFRSRLKGFVEQLGVDEGQRVKSGQLLFSISAREAAQEVKKAKAAVDVAAAELKASEVDQANTRLLFEKKISSQTEYDLATAKVAALKAKLEEAQAHEGQAQINFSYSQVRAPFDGVVNRIPRKVGAMVDEDEVLTTLTDTSEVLIYFRLSEQEYLDTVLPGANPAGAVPEKKQVKFKLANGITWNEPGLVDASETEFDEDTGNIAFRARFANPSGLLKHGSTGKVVVRTELGRTMVVPQAATFEIQELLYVYVVDHDDKPHATRIVPKARLEDTFVIESGLTQDDRIVLAGVHKVKEGERIIARQELTKTSSR